MRNETKIDLVTQILEGFCKCPTIGMKLTKSTQRDHS